MNGSKKVFKKGKSTTVARSIAAAVRTIAEEPNRNVTVRITGPRGGFEASVVASRHGMTITY
jgi:hypothetical protein